MGASYPKLTAQAMFIFMQWQSKQFAIQHAATMWDNGIRQITNRVACCQQIETISTYIFHTIRHQCYPIRACQGCQTHCEARQEDTKRQLWHGILPAIIGAADRSRLPLCSTSPGMVAAQFFVTYHISNRFVSTNLVPNLWVMHCRGLSQIGLSCPRFNLMFCSGVGLSREVCWELFVGPTVVVVGGNRWWLVMVAGFWQLFLAIIKVSFMVFHPHFSQLFRIISLIPLMKRHEVD